MRKIALFPLVSFDRELNLCQVGFCFMYLFACKTLTIVKDVEFQVNFSRYFSARDRPAQQEKDVLSFSPVVTIFTSFKPYLSSLSQNPKNAKACKTSMKVRQNVTRGILSSTLLAAKWISSE